MSTATLSKPGTLIHARGREWVVLPESSDALLIARPLGGLDEEITGILPAVEPVQSTAFPLPTRDDLGDFGSGQLLREAARLSTRAAAGPFRSFGRIAAEPRPYQLVPLMMALRLDPVRLLIADDVGIGKTIEAAVIARELLDRGEIRRLTVLCPPHLAEQWQRELAEKFHIEAELVLSSTIQRLGRDLPLGVSVFDRHRFTIVSTDFIKSTRRAEDFILKCPEFVIVDEAHGCTLAGGVGRGRQQRFELLRRVAEDKSRHLVLVTATPHSGNEDAFRSLLSLLDEEFANLPPDLDRAEREGIRRRLARHLVQRRRADIRHYLETDTAFPERKDKEAAYTFSKEYRALFDDIVAFARDYVSEDGGGGQRRRRVRYWSALALLRCVSSSPAAAAATLRSRAAVDLVDDAEVDEVGRRTVLDQDDADDVVAIDFSPGSDTESGADATRRKLLEFARRAEALSTATDHKFEGAVREVKALLKDGFQPVVFCRFVDTADYVARQLRGTLPAKVRIESATGLLPPAEREARIATLANEPGEYVLVCTDCLSEGINLQEHFNAVLHYDLAWNPTRHEQREGRVDRFGQKKREVRVVTYYGTDNPIDGVILDVLIRKHKSIKSDLGVTVAVPGSSEQIAEALFEGALFRETARGRPQQLSLDFIDELGPKKQAIHAEWDNARDREKTSRSRFAQHTLSPEVVAAELKSVRSAIGRGDDVARFFRAVLQAASVPLEAKGNAITVRLSTEVRRGLRQALGRDEPFTGRFDLPLEEGEVYLGRTSPAVEGVAGWTLDQALDPVARDALPVASRCGVVSTLAVSARTTLLVVRFRYHLQIVSAAAEEVKLPRFRGVELDLGDYGSVVTASIAAS
jgi:superfamily II DNA or RNA helicase